MCVYIVKLPPDTLPPWRQIGWRQCDLRPYTVIIEGVKGAGKMKIFGIFGKIETK